jgi:hypothetical protein
LRRSAPQMAVFYNKAQLFTFDFLFARNSFAGLVAYRAARFASGLAGASAFTASGNFLFSGFRNRFNHKNDLLIFSNFL